MERRPFCLWKMSVAAWLLLGLNANAATTIKSLEYTVVNGVGQFKINAGAPLNATQQDYPDEKQVVIDIDDAVLAPAASRTLDTSSFNSDVSMISPYPLDDGKKVRIVIQLRNNSKALVVPGSTGLVVKVSKNGFSEDQTAEANSAKEETPPEAAPQADQKDDKPQNELDQFAKANETQKYTGRPITLQVNTADVTDVLRLIGEASGFNMIISPGVVGKITLSLVDVPWDQVLDVVLQTMKLGAERSNNILRVMTLQELNAQRQETLQSKLIAQQSAPRVTKVFPISYADLSGLTTVLTTFGKSIQASGTGNAASAAGSGGIVQSDSRTNSIIVQDIPENVERMRKLIEILDTQTPQVMVEAKIVEASENFSHSISGQLGVGIGGKGSTKTAAFGSFAGGNPTDALIGNPGVFAAGSNIAAASTQSGVFGASPTISFIPGLQRLNALLTIGEQESQVKVVSAPKTVVLHRESASILQSIPVVLETTVTTSTSTSVQRQVTQANISMTVTPTVTNDESVLLTLNFTRDIPQLAAGATITTVANRNMNTKVLVDSGSTLVIGGIYTADVTQSGRGFPFLRKVPVLGALFGSESEATNRTELFIFVTPRILNAKRAGLKS